MDFSIDFKRLIYGQHFFSGFFAACGVIGLGLLWHSLFELATAMALSSGALCVSLVDVPSPLRQKRVDLAAAALGGAAATLLIALTRHSPIALGTAILVIGFAAAMLTAFGKRAMPLSFSPLLAMVLVFGVPEARSQHAAQHALLFLAGGMGYAIYGLVVGWLNRIRSKRQALAESLFELAEFARVSANFFKDDTDVNACYDALVTQQSMVTERQQGARDLVFADIAPGEELRLASALKEGIDVYEYLVSAQSDHALLKHHFAGTDTMVLLHDLVEKCAADLEQIAYAILRNRPARVRVHYLAELFALEHEMGRSPHAREAGSEARHALEALRATVYKLRHTTESIGTLRAIICASALPDERWLETGLAASFLSPSSYNARSLLDHLRFDSPVLRHALRSTLALAFGALVAHLLPYGTHSYWILLTIVVIMRSNFSAMRQRHGDRLMGNLIGCVAAALILYLDPHPPVIVAVLFVCVTVAHTFVTINYRYTSIAACVLALLHLNFANPDDFLIIERLFDTVVGALIAYAFSFLLPSWESANLPRQTRALLQACAAYGGTVLSRSADEHAYRLARKRLFDAIATISVAARSMLREPRATQRGIAPLHRFIATSYLLAAQLAALRVLLQRHGTELDQPETIDLLHAARAELEHKLAVAMTLIAAATGQASLTPDTEAAPAPPASNDWPADWDYSTRLRRRLGHLDAATDVLLAHTRNLSTEIG